MKNLKQKILFAVVILVSMVSATVISCSTSNKEKEAGENAANAESVTGATDGISVIEESAAQIAPAIDPANQ